MTLKQIIELVDETKDLDCMEQRKIAYSLGITECALYVLQMKKRHNKKVPI